MRVFKLTIQYEGSAYIGWQRQDARHGLSVQQALEETLQRVIGVPVTLHAAGRTDKGVHAWAQVAHFACPTAIPPLGLLQALNHLLPADIRILQVEEMPPDFHARYHACGKRYRYLLAEDTPDVFNWRWYWHLDKLPAVEPMQEAAQYLLGVHDFRHFTLANTTVKNFVRTIHRINIYTPEPAELPCILQRPLAIETEGSGFLYKMVRLIVCRLLAIGMGKLPPQAMQDYLAGLAPAKLPPAPPQGLMLMEVYYDLAFQNDAT